MTILVLNWIEGAFTTSSLGFKILFRGPNTSFRGGLWPVFTEAEISNFTYL
jgi:hypothetical protein